MDSGAVFILIKFQNVHIGRPLLPKKFQDAVTVNMVKMKSGPLYHFPGGLISLIIICPDTIQAKIPPAVFQDCRHRFGHGALVPVRFGKPVAKFCFYVQPLWQSFSRICTLFVQMPLPRAAQRIFALPLVKIRDKESVRSCEPEVLQSHRSDGL